MSPYRGRFAPFPTGPLHFGSLVAALGSCLEARSRAGQWLVRMEDLDRPREQPGAAELILRTLDAFGFEWDGEVMRQSGRSEAYEHAYARLSAGGALFSCACTRREIADSGLVIPAPDGELVYPGTCRNGIAPGRIARATRARVCDEIIAFEDAVQGSVRQNLAIEVGDFVVKRADGQYAYQLAVVVDDAELGITDVVRGADLLGSTGRQIWLQRLLDIAGPRYAHLPAAVNAQGEKLSKQTRARPLEAWNAAPMLAAALEFLGQRPPAELARAETSEVWRWARKNWDLARVPGERSRPAPPAA